MMNDNPVRTTLQKIFFPQNIFLLFGSIFGLLFVVITPPFQVADEPAHFYRAYQVSEGVIKGQRQQDVSGGLLPVSLASVSRQISGNIPFHPENKQEIGDLLRGLRMPLDRTERGFIPFVNTTIHTPLVYIPQAVGILFGRILSDSVLVLMYFGRLTNLIFWVALVYHAIKITPVFKYLFLVLALAPMSLFQAASLSADSLTNALSFLWIAVCLMFSCQRCTPIKKRELCMLLILSVMVSLSKQVYLILVFLVFLIPSDKFGGKRNKWRASLTLIVLSLVCSAGWLYSIRDIYVPFRDGIQIQTQLHFILSSPFKYAEILLGTFREQWWLLPAGYIGILGWLDTPLLLWQYPYYTVLFIAVALSERSVECLFSLKNRVLIFFVFLAGVILIFTSQYLSWTLPKASLIEGLQGRYFIPVCPLLLMLLYNQKISQIKVLNKFVFPVKMGFYLSITVSLICTIAVVIKRYY